MCKIVNSNGYKILDISAKCGYFVLRIRMYVYTYGIDNWQKLQHDLMQIKSVVAIWKDVKLDNWQSSYKSLPGQLNRLANAHFPEFGQKKLIQWEMHVSWTSHINLAIIVHLLKKLQALEPTHISLPFMTKSTRELSCLSDLAPRGTERNFGKVN